MDKISQIIAGVKPLDKMAMESPYPEVKDPAILNTWLYSE